MCVCRFPSYFRITTPGRVICRSLIRGQSYKANFGINYIKKGLNKLNFTLNYINFDVIYAKKVL